MASTREVTEEFERLMEDFRSKVTEVLEVVRARESMGPRTVSEQFSTELRNIQNEHTKITQRLRNYSDETSSTTRSMQAVRDSLSRFNSATINAISSGISSAVRGMQEIEKTGLRLHKKGLELEGIDIRRAEAVTKFEETQSKLTTASKLETIFAEDKNNRTISRIQELSQPTEEQRQIGGEITGIETRIAELREAMAAAPSITARAEMGTEVERLRSELREKQERKAEIDRSVDPSRERKLAFLESKLKDTLTGAGIDVSGSAIETLKQKILETTGKELSELTPKQLKNAIKELTGAVDVHTDELKNLTDDYENESKQREGLVKELKDQKMDMLKSALNSLVSVINELVLSIRKTQQQFGITASQAASVKFGNLKESVDSYISAILPGGKSGAPVSREQIAAVQGAFQSEFGGLVTSETARRIAQRGVEEGITPEQQAAARRAFMTITGDRGLAIAAETKFIQTFKDANLTSKDAMEAATKYSELIARNGTRFGDAFARAAKEAKQIGVDLSAIDQFGDNIINNFEGFLEAQAELGAMGFGFDTSRLAEIAATGNTAALQAELQAQLRTTGKNLDQLNRPERLSLEAALGMPISQIQKLARGESSGETIEDLTKKSNEKLDDAVNALQALGGVIGGIAATNGLLVIANSLLSSISTFTGITAGRSALGGLPGMAASAARFLPPAALLAGGALLTNSGINQVEQGNRVSGTIRGAGGGALITTGLLGLAALLGAIPTGGASLAALPYIVGGGAALGAVGANVLADDMVSKPGYGERVLVTPTATVALNDQDNVVAYADDMVSQEAGLKLLSKGAITGTVTQDFSNLEKVFEKNLSKLQDTFTRMASNPQVIRIDLDGKEVGRGIYNSSTAVQSLSTYRIGSEPSY